MWLFWRGSYVKYALSGAGTIHMAFTRSHPRENPTGVYYAKYRAGAFYRASGSRIRTVRQLPLRPRDADKVYDARKYRASGWVHDVAVGPDGRTAATSVARPAGPGSREIALRATVVDLGPSPPLTMEWQLGDGQTAYGSSVTHRYSHAGRYFPRLRLRDAAGRESVYVGEIEVR